MKPPKPELDGESDYNPHEEGVVVWMRDTTGPVRFTRGWVWFVEASGALCLRGAANLESGAGEIIFPPEIWSAVATDHEGKTMIQARSPSLYQEALRYAETQFRTDGNVDAAAVMAHIVAWGKGTPLPDAFWSVYHREIRTGKDFSA